MIVRIYTGDDGQTHFEDLPLPAEESHNVALQAGANLMFRCFPADHWSDWHTAPRRQYIFLITHYRQPFCSRPKPVEQRFLPAMTLPRMSIPGQAT
jgi:hypothetical protein